MNIPASEILRVATINICNNPDTFEKRLESLGEHLALLSPDIIAFQEAIFTTSKGANSAVHKVADHLGMNVLTTSSPTRHPSRQGVVFANATLVRKSVDQVSGKAYKGNSLKSATVLPDVLETRFRVNNRLVVVFNVHLAWGYESEFTRLQQVRDIDVQAKKILREEPEALILLVGDFNTEPESDTLRYLFGHHVVEEESTKWIDSWKMLRDPSEDGYTSLNYGSEATKTAFTKGIVMPQMMPRRRIDYMLVHGWVYGKACTPLGVDRFGFADSERGVALSDHYGLYTDYWCPEPK